MVLLVAYAAMRAWMARLLNRPGFHAASFLAKDAVMPKKYPSEQRERATRMVLERIDDYPSVWAAAQALGPKLGIGVETLRKWVVQAQVDQGQRQGPTSEELAEIKRLRAENRDLKEANEILKAASIFFARELDPRHR
jgi:transposase-like protein